MTKQDNLTGFNDIWLILFLLLGTLVLWSTVIEQTTFGRIYQIIFFFTLAMYMLSKVSPKFSEFENLRNEGIVLQIVTGLALGFALVGTLYGTFALLAPLSVPDIKFTSPLGILGFESLSQVFLMSIVVAEIEESFRSSSLRPTIAEWLGNKQARIVFLLVTAIIIYMVISPLRFLGAAMFIFAVIDGLGDFKITNRFFTSFIGRHGIAIIVAASFFAVLHLRAYGATVSLATTQTTALLLNAFLFAVVADIINMKFRSTTSSKVAHCMNNSTISAVSVGLPAYIGLFITMTYATILFFMSRGTLEDFSPKRIIESLGGV